MNDTTVIDNSPTTTGDVTVNPPVPFIDKLGGRKFVLAVICMIGIIIMPIPWSDKKEAVSWIFGLFAAANTVSNYGIKNS